jgi:putative endonuclease
MSRKTAARRLRSACSAPSSEPRTAGSARAPSDRLELARRGEALVADQLRAQGFEIVGMNVRVGRLELDIIAQRGSLLVVCEVRTRRKPAPIFPSETLGPQKLERLRRASAQWLREQPAGTGRRSLRIDAAAVILPPDGSATIEYYENISYPLRSY